MVIDTGKAKVMLHKKDNGNKDKNLEIVRRSTEVVETFNIWEQ